jgi:two-component system chemotaxis sensor kinase CheA
MSSLLADFILEARELLEDTNANLLALEKDPDNAEIVNTSFRAMHTLKGDSGLVGLPEITRLLHAAEDVLDGIRQNTLAFRADIADALLQVADCVTGWLDHLEDTERLPAGATEEAAPLIARLHGFLSREPDTESSPGKTVSVSAVPSCAWLDQVTAEIRDALLGEMAETGKTLLAVSYQPDEGCFFRGEDPFFLAQQIEETRWQAVSTTEELPALDGFDPFHCLLSFRALAFASREGVEDLFRYVLPQVQIMEIGREALAGPSAAQSLPISLALTPSALIERGLGIESQEALTELLRQMEVGLGTPGDPALLAGRVRSTAAILRNCAAHLRENALLQPIEDALEDALKTETVAPLLGLVSGLLTELDRSEPLRVSDIAPDGIGTQAVPEEAGPDRQKAGVKHVLKVDQARIDGLMNLIAEMVVAKNSLPYLAERAAAVYGVRDLSREIKEHYSVINRITQEMQDAIMEVRMLPVSHALQRFPRLVRDTARKLNKNVELVLEGEETEVDKNIVEALGDPLMHIIRNSLDHGIEMLQERLAVGKPAHGTIRIKASQDNGRALIEIRDDGGGIDPERVKRKALERGLIEEEALATLSDHDAVQLVFRAGFSTVEQISDLSGRGVGMDVVRSAVEQVGGSVQLNSQKGKGTQILLSLPMTMTSTRAMVVEADGQSFGVPLDIITETFRVPPASIFRIKHKEVLIRRDRTMPVVRLRTMLGLPPAPDLAEDEEYAVLIARVCGESVALLMDDFADIVEVILKPMEGVMSGSRGLTSTAILGDGTILLMLDLEGLL